MLDAAQINQTSSFKIYLPEKLLGARSQSLHIYPDKHSPIKISAFFAKTLAFIINFDDVKK
jgi:hypothetical protein